MPRKRQQGGPRVGNPTRGAYPNRSDLNGGRPVPAKVATGQTYGKAQSQLNAQRLVPMAAPPTVVPPPTSPAATPGSPPPTNQQAVAQPMTAQGIGGVLQQAPRSSQPLDRPSERPWEPVTAGAASGAGPGPQVLPQGPLTAAGTSLSTMLQAVATQTGSTAVQALAQHAMANGQ